ncbi:MAG: hypothetical protein G8345_03885 [Magnetococcales bacterium]|nr:hypothetical protein [Magnetococcales bacterium]NGZ26012.1 hypothetical protein [Magnetococcales bacterium]
MMVSWLLSGCATDNGLGELERNPLARIGILKEKKDCQDYIEFLGSKGVQYGCKEI